MEFVCLNKNLINKVKNLFNECKIDIKKIVSYDYAKKFLNNVEDNTLCFSAFKILMVQINLRLFLQKIL